VSTSVLVTWRCFLAALGAFAWAALRNKDRKPVSRKQAIQLLGVGGLIALHWMCLFGAVKVANVSIALAGLATLSLFTAFTEPWLIRRRVRPFEVLLGLLVLGGIALIAGVQQAHLFGLILALLSALLAAIFVVLNQRLVIAGVDPMKMVGWEMSSSAFVCLMAVPWLDPAGLSGLWIRNPLDWLWIGILAVACTVFAQALTNHLLRTINAYTFNLVANFEPVYGMLAAALLFGEHRHLSPTFYLGASCILLANFLHPWLQKRFTRRIAPD
jgi:drug/metabolite transporter (DMT)-like permease